MFFCDKHPTVPLLVCFFFTDTELEEVCRPRITFTISPLYQNNQTKPYRGMFISNDWKLQHITNCASMIGFMLLIAHMKAGIISHLKIYAFCEKVRQSKLTVSYTKYRKIVIKFRLSKILKKCLNYQMRTFTSFYISYQQHASKH